MEISVEIRVKDRLHRSFLGALFERRGDGFAVSMLTLSGAAICALVQTAERPSHTTRDETTVKFYLPQSHCNDSLRNKHLYVSPEGETKINSCLRAEFESRFIHFCGEARMQGYKQKDIIPIFMAVHKIALYDGDIEAPKKRLYRKDMELLENFEKKLRRKAYLAASAVRKTMRDNLID